MNESARLTFLIDPEKKRAFELLCASQDLTVSQVLRRFIAEQLQQDRVDGIAEDSDLPANG